MTLEERSRLSCYKEISVLNEAHRVYLVQHTLNGRIYVKKTLKVFDLSVLTQLKENPIPHIPRIYELFQEGDSLILIEEYINGSSLQELMDTYGLPSQDISVNYVLQLCRILYDLHHFHPPIIHRDIKPSNVIVSEDGTLTLIDLDAAKYAKDEQTRDTRLLGTQGYAAPEQYGFRPSGPETDIYALGVLLNVLLTGHFPQDRTAPEPFRNVIETCTKMDPEERYPDADILADALVRTVNGSSGTSRKSFTRNSISDLPSDNPPELTGWKKFIPPGFRTGKVWKMILGILGYAAIFIVALNWRQEGASQTKHFIFRIGCLGMFLSIALFSANYLGVQNMLHFNRIQKPVLRILLIILADVVIVVIWIIIIGILSGILLKET